MHRDRFTDAELVYKYEPPKGKGRRLMSESAENRATVNAYCLWLRKKEVPYEVRLHSAGYYLVKSTLGGL